MMIRSLCAPLLLCLASSCETGGSRPRNESTPIDGTWSALAADLGGEALPEELRKTMRLVIDEGTCTVTVADRPDKGIVVLNPRKQPKTMDITWTTGPKKDKRILAIYETTGDTLRICYDLSGNSRPTGFKTEKGTQLFLVLYAREA